MNTPETPTSEPVENRIEAKTEKEQETTPQQEANYQYFMRLNRIFTLAVAVVGIVITILYPTWPHVAGLLILAALISASLLFGRFSKRNAGFAPVVVAALTAIIAKFAREDWPVEPQEIGEWAVGMGALGLTWIYTNKKTGEPEERFENISGALAVVGLLGIAGIAVSFGSASVANPTALVTIEGIAALVDMAGERWKWRLSFALLLPFAGILVEVVHPGWRPLSLQRIKSSWTLLWAHSHAWMAWPILFAGVNDVILCLKYRVKLRILLLSSLGAVTVVWVCLLIVDVLRYSLH